ncbi:hypothetical protein ACFE04_022104 [Oxalis oulophora]
MLQSYSIHSHTFLHHYHYHYHYHYTSPSITITQHKPITLLHSLSIHPRLRPCLAQSEDPTSTKTITINVPSSPEFVDEGDGPIQLPSSTIFATTDEPTTLQVATSVLLTGAITVFLFRAIRRRAQRAKELRYRSSGVKKSLKEEAIENLKSVTVGSKGPPSAIQTFLGAIAAGVIALILYKFTITIEDSLNRQTLSDSYSVRQITVTIRTIINGICYLATCVFGVNSIGLFLLSGQLALKYFMKEFAIEDTQNKDGEQLVSSAEISDVSDSRDGEQNSEDKQQ